MRELVGWVCVSALLLLASFAYAAMAWYAIKAEDELNRYVAQLGLASVTFLALVSGVAWGLS